MSSNDFAQRVGELVSHGFTAVGISMGTRLGLFRALAELSQSKQTACSTLQLANHLNFKERYIREWIAGMVCADIVDHVEVDGENRYWLAPHRVPALTGVTALSSELLIGTSENSSKVVKCFPLDGPLGTEVDDYPVLHAFLAQRPTGWKTSKDPGSLLADEELVGRLEDGIHVLEMGCGSANPIKAMAARFPKSSFVASDLTENTLALAKENCKGLDNVSFAVVDACNVPDEMRGKFDFALLFDVFHDVAYPDQLLSGVWKLLKPDGRFMMNEIEMCDTLNENKTTCADSGAMLYIISTLYCLPTSLNSPSGAGLGACAGVKKFEELLADGGFTVIQKRIDDTLGLTFLTKKQPHEGLETKRQKHN